MLLDTVINAAETPSFTKLQSFVESLSYTSFVRLFPTRILPIQLHVLTTTEPR